MAFHKLRKCSGDWISNVRPCCETEAMQRRMAFKQCAPQRDISNREKITEDVETNHESMWMQRREKRDLAFKAPFQFRSGLPSLSPVHVIAVASPPQRTITRACAPFFKRYCKNRKIAPRPFQNYSVNLGAVLAGLKYSHAMVALWHLHR
jgi:hypothetical protein